LLILFQLICGCNEILQRLSDLNVILTQNRYFDLGSVFVDLLRLRILFLHKSQVSKQIQRRVDFFSIILGASFIECLINNALGISILTLINELRCMI